MKRSILFLFFIGWVFPCLSQYAVRGGTGIPLQAANDTRNRLEVYLLNGLAGAQITFTSSNPGTHQWYRYAEQGANNAVQIPSVQNGNTSTITDIQEGCGYFVGSPTEELPHYVWIIDYSRYIPRFFNLEASEEEDKCKFLKILADVEAEPLTYYLPSGAPDNLTRIYHLQYTTQEWLENEKRFVPKEENLEIKGLISEIVINAPLENTRFTLTGDNFAEYFDRQQAIRSTEYRAIAVEAYGIIETDKEHAENEIHTTGDALGGSAPIEYTFTAYANEPIAALFIWKVSRQNAENGEMTTIVRYTDKVLRYNFEKEGTYHVELEVSDVQSVCMVTKPFKVVIDNTVIKIPNAFSPGGSFGVNDELKISFSSLITFKASVYNRWGNLLYQWSDPAKGWNGRVNGKFVPAGAYYVIVEYKDANGKKRSMSRAVNVLRTKN